MTEQELFALFAFALRENDWELADLIATALLRREPTEARLNRELRSANRPGSPGSLSKLRHWASITNGLALEDPAE